VRAAVALLFAGSLVGCSFEVRGLNNRPAAEPEPQSPGVGSGGPSDLGPPPVGKLVVSGAASEKSAALTSQGSVDWIHFGREDLTDVNRKGMGGQLISNFTTLMNGELHRYGDNRVAFSWTDGMPVPTEDGTTTGVWVGGIGEGFSLFAPADTTERTLIVYLGGYFSSATFTAQLSDGSAPEFVSAEFASLESPYWVTVTLRYRAGTAGQTLQLSWRQTSTRGNVTLQAAALN
jgi:hypothetical protein